MGRDLRILLLLVASALAAPRPAAADDVPSPRFDRVDHAKPDRLLELDAKAGEPKAIRAIAQRLRGKTPEETLRAIDRWMVATLEWDEDVFDGWRPIERMVADGTYGGCADHAMAFGTIARACGIPTVWVKTMDVAWIEAFRGGRFDENRDAWSGHVFLEVFLDGAWRLLDAQAGVLYMRYDPTSRLLPGRRFAYDKGGKPWDLVLSVRWPEWKTQTSAHFKTTDPARETADEAKAEARIGDPRPLNPEVLVAGNRPRWVWAQAAARSAGYRLGPSFNTGFEKALPAARGKVLVVLCSRGQPVFPAEQAAEWLPTGWREKAASGDLDGPGWSERRLADGTRVVLVTARERDRIAGAIREALAAR